MTELRDNRTGSADSFYQKWPKATVSAVLDYACQWHIESRDSWTRPLAKFPAFVAEWLKDNKSADERALKLVAGAARLMVLSELDRAAWSDVVLALDNAPENYARRISVIIVILALFDETVAGKGLGDLFIAIYDRVDFAVSRSRLSEWEWFAMQDRLPDLSWWEGWDRAKRLRLGAIEVMNKYDLPVERLIKSISEVGRLEQFQRLINDRYS